MNEDIAIELAGYLIDNCKDIRRQIDEMCGYFGVDPELISGEITDYVIDILMDDFTYSYEDIACAVDFFTIKKCLGYE